MKWAISSELDEHGQLRLIVFATVVWSVDQLSGEWRATRSASCRTISSSSSSSFLSSRLHHLLLYRYVVIARSPVYACSGTGVYRKASMWLGNTYRCLERAITT